MALASSRTSAVLLGMSYFLLVVIIAFGAFWVQNQFDEAERERCEVLAIEIKLAQLEVVLLQEQEQPPPPPGFDAEVDELRAAILDRVQQSCPGSLPA